MRKRAAVSLLSLAILLLCNGRAIAQPPTPSAAGRGTGAGAQRARCIADADIRMAAAPDDVALGDATTISWSVKLPAGCGRARVLLEGASVPLSGSRHFSPLQSRAYSVIVRSPTPGGSAETRSVQVTVTYPPVVVIDPRTQNPVGVLIEALANAPTDHQTVELCNVDLDLTGHAAIVIGDNRSLIASPACERGPRQTGPRLFVRDDRQSKALFEIRGDSVRFSGFRLEGPTSGIGQGNVKEKGILISPFEGADPIRSIEISNMEIYDWSGVGVEVGDNSVATPRGRLSSANVGAVHIVGSYFHHNRHSDGEGYGVSVTGGAYALIERNVFDENRHAIAGGSRSKDGSDWSGYTVRDNLILAGGGRHCAEQWWGALTGWRLQCRHTHQIDMHGDDNRWYSNDNWECGKAGETLIIQRNTILYTEGTAIKIRGNPTDRAVVDGNVFKQRKSDAIDQNGACGGWGDNITNPIDVRPNNQFRVDPMAQLGSCDFAGDGQQDEFMATGVTWWAKSPVTGQWRYLNTMTERLPELELRAVGGDSTCDVVPRGTRPEAVSRVYSKSGTSPWTPMAAVEVLR
jgi:hypothetical protein